MVEKMAETLKSRCIPREDTVWKDGCGPIANKKTKQTNTETQN